MILASAGPLSDANIGKASAAFAGGGSGFANPTLSTGTASNANALGGQAPSYYQTYQAATTGLGTALAVYTYTGTYATDYATLQLLHNKVRAIETILRSRNIATT